MHALSCFPPVHSADLPACRAAGMTPEAPKFDAVAFEQTAGLRPPSDNLTDVERRQQVLPDFTPAHCRKDVAPM